MNEEKITFREAVEEVFDDPYRDNVVEPFYEQLAVESWTNYQAMAD